MAATHNLENRTGCRQVQGKTRTRATLTMLDGSKHQVSLNRPALPVECFRCGICCKCYQPQLSTEEIETISRKLGLSQDDFLAKYAQRTTIGYLLRQTDKGCVFLTWEEAGTRASCRIYPFRPEACRNWTPSLLRRECLAGLARLKSRGRLMLASELYPSQNSIDRFHSTLVDVGEGSAVTP